MLVATTVALARNVETAHVYLDGRPIPIISRYEHEPRPWPDGEQRTLGRQLLTTSTGTVHRFTFEAEHLTETEWAHLLDTYERTRGGSRVPMRLEEWPDAMSWSEAITATRQAISVPNPGPHVWPVFVIEAGATTDTPGLTWRGGNMALNGRAERADADDDIHYWTDAGGAKRVRTIVPPGEGRRYAFRTTNTATFTQALDVIEGQTIKVAALAYAAVNATYSGLLQLSFNDANGDPVDSPASTSADLTQGWVEVTHAVQVPATAVTAELLLDSSTSDPVYWSDVQAYVVEDANDELPTYREGYERKVEIDAELDPGDVVEILPQAGIALLNGQAVALTSESGFFSLPSGANQLVATAASGTDWTLHVRLDWMLPVKLQMRSDVTPFGFDKGWQTYGRRVRFDVVSA